MDLKIKCNSVCWACLVACRYSQVLGVNFLENYLLVVNDITFHILIIRVIHFRFFAKIVNVETAFLYRELEEEIYMECPLKVCST